ncbi:MAG TPA: CBS domain-containing protein [Chloroflexota bacterium]|nr:CBS domain-containing protein [Chloroflexota bacterium]
MSARAAWRLEETLGFDTVYRYTPGKVDWLAAGLPREGEMAAVPRIGDVADRDVPTCGTAERVGEVRRRLQQDAQDPCVVLGQRRVVLGRVRAKDLEANPDAAVEDVMDPGPVTYRPDTLLAELVEHLQQLPRSKANRILVTTSDGELIGLLRRADAERILKELHAQHADHAEHERDAAQARARR